MRQELLWIPEAEDRGAFVKKAPLVPFPYETRPMKVWTLYTERDPDKTPQLPLKSRHHHGAFKEGYIHDWEIRNGEFFDYFSRVIDGYVWLLLEWEE